MKQLYTLLFIGVLLANSFTNKILAEMGRIKGHFSNRGLGKYLGSVIANGHRLLQPPTKPIIHP